MTKINTDYLLSANGALKLLVIANSIQAVRQAFNYIRTITGISLVFAIAIFYTILLDINKKLPFFNYIDILVCFTMAILLFINGVLTGVMIQTAASVFTFLAVVAWILSGIACFLDKPTTDENAKETVTHVEEFVPIESEPGIAT